MKQMTKEISRVLKALAGRLDGFYLAGGTALSLFYFNHRESYDIDLFSQEFSRKRAEGIIGDLSHSINRKISLVGQEMGPERARMMVYSCNSEAGPIKIDFVEDFYKLIKPLKTIDGIPVLDKADIYIRKIYAACGAYSVINEIGKKEFKGGRQEAKDLFDLYFLSTTFIPFSKFAYEHCDPAGIESIIVWYKTYNRMEMKLGLNDIATDKKVDFHAIEHHFRDEVSKLIFKEI